MKGTSLFFVLLAFSAAIPDSLSSLIDKKCGDLVDAQLTIGETSIECDEEVPLSAISAADSIGVTFTDAKEVNIELFHK